LQFRPQRNKMAVVPTLTHSTDPEAAKPRGGRRPARIRRQPDNGFDAGADLDAIRRRVIELKVKLLTVDEINGLVAAERGGEAERQLPAVAVQLQPAR
jgi:hypothetical protein